MALTLPQLFYDTGSGFSPRGCLTATEDVYNELTHEVSVTFVLPEDARAIRLDPGELACCITDLAISDERSASSRSTAFCCRRTACCFWT